jgi:SAM-dependent methyltransferase
LDLPLITQAFRDGRGLGWEKRNPSLFRGTERFFRPVYLDNLIRNWIPALEDVEEKLQRGARVADIGCGHGASTLLMAQSYPKSKFTGFDYHPASIEAAQTMAEMGEYGDGLKFEVASSKAYPGEGYDLVTFFDCLHDMGDPVGAAEHVRRSLAPDGTWMIVEPFAHDRLESNVNPIGRVFYAASTMICTPVSMSQEVGLALGAQAGELRLREVITKGGFSRFRRTTETPFNIVYEARP